MQPNGPEARAVGMPTHVLCNQIGELRLQHRDLLEHWNALLARALSAISDNPNQIRQLARNYDGILTRTIGELLFPHLSPRCGRQSRKLNEINGDFLEWCGREDSNLHGLPR